MHSPSAESFGNITGIETFEKHHRFREHSLKLWKKGALPQGTQGTCPHDLEDCSLNSLGLL